jgi:hypothetical protein
MENVRQDQLVESRDVWKRGVFMLLFAIAFGIEQMVLNTMAVVQFLSLLVTRERNECLARFGVSLSNWFGEVSRFQSCSSDDKPFPWRPGLDSACLPRRSAVAAKVFKGKLWLP